MKRMRTFSVFLDWGQIRCGAFKSTKNCRGSPRGRSLHQNLVLFDEESFLNFRELKSSCESAGRCIRGCFGCHQELIRIPSLREICTELSLLIIISRRLVDLIDYDPQNSRVFRHYETQSLEARIFRMPNETGTSSSMLQKMLEERTMRGHCPDSSEPPG